MKNKRALADFILKEHMEKGKDRDQRDGPLVLSKEDLVDILVKFEEEVEHLPFKNRSNNTESGGSE